MIKWKKPYIMEPYWENLNGNEHMKKLGNDSVQVVKYVYTNVKKIDDESTQSNLVQIKKSLDLIPDLYKK